MMPNFGQVRAAGGVRRTKRSLHPLLAVVLTTTLSAAPALAQERYEEAKLTASDGATSDGFGVSVAVSGDTMVIGASGDDASRGSAYVFARSGSNWIQAAKLTASDGTAGDIFGISVAVSGDTVVVGARQDDIGPNMDQGSVYVFVKPGGGWSDITQTAKLTASDGANGDILGIGVAVFGDTIVAGATFDDVGANADQGSAYVFVKPGGGWSNMTQTAKLNASDGAAGDEFGREPSISGATIVVGAAQNDIGPNIAQGSAYVFVKPGPGWTNMTQTARLTASDGATNDVFGASVSVSGDTVVVSSHKNNADQGAAYVFVKPGGGWTDMTQTAKLTASDGAPSDFFSRSVAVSADTIVIGALGDDASRGSAYAFVKPGGGWADMTQTVKLIATDGAAGDQFGFYVSASGDKVVIGAVNDDIGANANQGSAYAFTLGVLLVNASATGLNNGASWSNAFTSLQSALAVAVSGDEIWVAAGTYKPDQGGGQTPGDRAATFQLINGVGIYGGFFGGESSRNVRDPANNVTILSGDLSSNDLPNFVNYAENSYHVVSGSGVNSPTVLDGFRIRGGNASEGGNSHGGGFYLTSGASPQVVGCTIIENNTQGNGGGVYCEGNSAAVFADCVFLRNASGFDGGGIYQDNGPAGVTVLNCRFLGNSSAANGGGIRVKKGALITNSIFSGNIAANGGGIDTSGPQTPNVISGCTFVGNTALPGPGTGDGGGVHDGSGGEVTPVTNCALWGNTGNGTTEQQQFAGEVAITYSIVQGLVSGGTGNLSADPLFVDADGADNIAGNEDDDLRLQSGSPAIDAGNTPALPLDTFDLDGDGNTTERISLDVGGNPRVLDDPTTSDTGVPGSSVVDMGAHEYFPDCNGNQIPDGCDLVCGPADGPCDLPGECGQETDCNANSVLDACDIADCDALDPDYPACDDCNLNGKPDGCDVPLSAGCADGSCVSACSADMNQDCVPDECVDPDASANWSDDIWDLTATDPYPDNLNPNAVPDLTPNIGAGIELLLDVTVEVNALWVEEGATLNVTDSGDGDLFIAGSSPQTAGDVLPESPFKVNGNLFLANDRTVTVHDFFGVEPAGVVMKQPGAGATSAEIIADYVIINGATCDALKDGGELSLDDDMKLTSSGWLYLGGYYSVCPGGCAAPLITPPPKLRVRSNAVAAWAGGMYMPGAVDLLVDSTVAVEVGANFSNTGKVPHLFDWTAGKLKITGGNSKTFEVAGINLGPSTAGFSTDVDVLYDTCPHTNYSMGAVEVAAGANVTFANQTANTKGLGCLEALYVGELIFRAGSTVTINNTKVYYGTLINEGVTPTLQGCAQLTPVDPRVLPGPSGPAGRTMALIVPPSGSATASGSGTAIKVTMIDLQNPVPPNLPANPPPDYSSFEMGTCGDPGGCIRWVGNPRTFLESQDNPGIGSLKAARLQCTPYYHDFASEGLIHVVGAEIVPSSTYEVRVYLDGCKGNETACPLVSFPVTMVTRRYGDVEAPFNPPSTSTQPNAIDVTQLVNKFKNVLGAPSKPLAQLQPNLVELNADINALDIVAVVDAVKQFAYPFSGPCPCPSMVTCGATNCASPGICTTTYGAGALCVKSCTSGDNLGDPCINNTHCPGGSCGAGACRDRCGRCTP